MSGKQKRQQAGTTVNGQKVGGQFAVQEHAGDSVATGELRAQQALAQLRQDGLAELEEIRALDAGGADYRVVWPKEQALAEKMVRAEIRAKYPTAAVLILANANEGPGAPMMDPERIEDADGNVLAEYQDDFELTDWIGNWTAMMDRDESRYEQLSSGWSREQTWKFVL